MAGGSLRGDGSPPSRISKDQGNLSPTKAEGGAGGTPHW